MAHKAARPPARRKAARATGQWWSQGGARRTAVPAADPTVFLFEDPLRVARALKRAAEAGGRHISNPYRSAMSMLTFYINRAGKRLPKRRLLVLENAKDELRNLFHRAR